MKSFKTALGFPVKALIAAAFCCAVTPLLNAEERNVFGTASVVWNPGTNLTGTDGVTFPGTDLTLLSGSVFNLTNPGNNSLISVLGLGVDGTVGATLQIGTAASSFAGMNLTVNDSAGTSSVKDVFGVNLGGPSTRYNPAVAVTYSGGDVIINDARTAGTGGNVAAFYAGAGGQQNFDINTTGKISVSVANGDAGITAGVYTQGGSANVAGTVEIAGSKRVLNAAGSAYMNTYGVYAGKNASAGIVNLTGISYDAIITGTNPTHGDNDTVGVFSRDGSAIATGAVKIDGLINTMTNANGDVSSDNQVYGVYADQDAEAQGSVSITNIVHTVTGSTEAEAYDLIVGVCSDFGNAAAAGDITISASISVTSGTGAASGYSMAEGVYAAGRATVSGNIDIDISGSAQTTGGTDEQLTFAAGVRGTEIIINGDGKHIVVASSGEAYAIGVLLYDGDDNLVTSTITTLNGAVTLQATSRMTGSNSFIGIEGDDGSAVSVAEYIGFSAGDTLNINPGAGKTFDNSGKAFRVFGAENINFNSGTTALKFGTGAGEGWFSNQKDFDPDEAFDDEEDPGRLSNFGVISGGPRTTTATINSGATLRASGNMNPVIGDAQKVHTTRFSTDGKFTAGVDYNFVLNVVSGGALALDGNLEMTGTAGLLAGSNVTLNGHIFTVNGDATFDGTTLIYGNGTDTGKLAVTGNVGYGDLAANTVSLAAWQTGTFDILTAGNALDLAQFAIDPTYNNPRQSANIALSADGKTLQLTTAGTGTGGVTGCRRVCWNGTNDGTTWNTEKTNWEDAVSPANSAIQTFAHGDTVVFAGATGSGSGVISIPNAMTVSGMEITKGTYNFSGEKITGSAVSGTGATFTPSGKLSITGDGTQAIFANDIAFEKGVQIGAKSLAIFANISGDLTNDGSVAATGISGNIVNNSVLNVGAITGSLVTGKNSVTTVGQLNGTGNNAGLLNITGVEGALANNAGGTIKLIGGNGTDYTFTGNLTNNGLVDFVNLGRTLTVGDIAGNGTIRMDVNLTTGEKDTLVVNGNVAGRQTILLTNVGDANDVVFVDGIDDIVVLETTSAGANAGSFVGTLKTPLYNYILDFDGTGFSLVQGTYSSSAQAITNTVGAMAVSWFSQLDNLHKRMGDLRVGASNTGGNCTTDCSSPANAGAKTATFWTRAYGQQTNVDLGIAGMSSFKEYQYGADIGGDIAVAIDTENTAYFGAFAGYQGATRRFHDGLGSKGNTDSVYAGVYGTWIHADGWYADGVVKGQYFDNEYEADGDSGDFDNYGLGASLELGKAFTSVHGWFVEPSVQFAYMHVFSDSYSTDSGLRVTAGDSDVYRFAGGIRFGKTINLGTGGVIQPYAKIGIEEQISDGGSVRIASERFEPTTDGTRMTAGAGIVWQLDDAQQIHLDYEGSFGDKYDKPWAINVGYRIGF